ncbi:MAG: 3-hydroxybutyryl-CoA dehydratase [Alphaproteobacteria bacterium]|jgi:3-hydroxybutyryl-CoA dehydratase
MTLKPTACLSIEDLEVGQSHTKTYTVTDDMLKAFAQVSGDYNPAHFNDAYAANTRFKRRIAHGCISIAQFSGIFGMDMPGLGTVWVSQTIEFLAPVEIGKPYTAVATVIAKEKRSATIKTESFDSEGNKVVTGEGVVYPIPARVKAKMVDDLPNILA